MFESYPIQDCQHFWTARASGLKEETGFLEAPAEARGSRALRGDLSVSANPLLEQRSRAVQGIFISDYALLQWLHWSRRPFKWLRMRGRLNRLHRAAEPPNWSHPSQHQTSWPVKISEPGGVGGVVVWEVEGGERWERLLLSASDHLLLPLQLWPSSPGGGKQSDVTLIITAANHSNHGECKTARIGLWFHLCQILRSSFCTKGGEVKSNDSGHSHKKSLNPTPLSDKFSEQSIVSWRLKIMPSPVKTWNWSFQYFLLWPQCKWSHMWWGSNTTQFPSPVPLNVTTRDRFCHLSWHFRRWLSVTWF